MFLKLVERVGGGLGKQIHTQMCLAALFDQRRKVENEWNDDDDEQRQIFHEEEKNRGQHVPSDPLGDSIVPSDPLSTKYGGHMSTGGGGG